MAIFARMLRRLTAFLNRPIAEDFRFGSQVWSSAQGGIYVFLFLYLFLGGLSVGGNSRVLLLALFGLVCALSTLVANWLVPLLLPRIYDADRWTVWKFGLQTLFLLFCISIGNQLVLLATGNPYPPFWRMYTSVTIIGFFPIILSVFIVEQRRLKRTLAHAQALNKQLADRPVATPAGPATPAPSHPLSPPQSLRLPLSAPPPPVLLQSENGKERLTLQPDQLLYVESVGNYVEVHWRQAGGQLQKTVLRSTLRDVAQALAGQPQFLRCHRAYLVNLAAVSHTEGNARGYQLTLAESPATIPVSRSYLDVFDERINTLFLPSHSSQN